MLSTPRPRPSPPSCISFSDSESQQASLSRTRTPMDHQQFACRHLPGSCIPDLLGQRKLPQQTPHNHHYYYHQWHATFPFIHSSAKQAQPPQTTCARPAYKMRPRQNNLLFAGCFDEEEEAARAYDKMMLWCELHATAGVRPGMTNFELAEYDQDVEYLRLCTQVRLPETRHRSSPRVLSR